MNLETTLTCIGLVRSDLKQLEDCPLQEHEGAPSAWLEIYPPFLDACKSLQCNTDIMLFTWLHRANRTVMETRPRNNPRNPLVGVFSTRSPDRPNPIGVHKVRIIEIKTPNQFRVSALEALDQTPIIDIKPALG